MKHLAIDFGLKRLGLAISDEQGVMAVPYEVRERQSLKRDIAGIVETARGLRAERIVLGLPRAAHSGAIHHEEQIRGFADALEKALAAADLEIPLVWWDERFSTSEALGQMRALGISTRQGKESVDARAASVILQGYLDAQRQPTAENRANETYDAHTPHEEDDSWLN
jgi:putative Holliday junction resolvase